MHLYISIAIYFLTSVAFSLGSAPVYAQALGNDALVTGEITRVGQIDQYTFNANAGDIVFITVADLEQGSFGPSVRLFDSGGTLVKSDADSLSAGILDYKVLSGGLHTITVQDLSSTNTGTYELRFVSVPGTNELGRLQGSTMRTEFLDLADIDTFTFSATAGEHVFLDFRPKEDTSISFALRLYNPAGELDTFSLESLTSAALKNFEIDSTGIWTVVIYDRFLDGVGEYNLYFSQIPGANEKGTLPNDARRSAMLQPGDIDTWTFNAESGDRIHLSATDSDVTGMTVELFLYGPGGTFLDSDVGSITAFISSFEIEEDGLHTVVVKDLNRNNTERYELHFARVPGAAEFGPLSGITSLVGDIYLGDIDTFEFGAAFGSNITINIADLDDAPFRPHVFVYEDNGNQVATARNTNIARIDFVAPQTGIYTVVLQDSALDDVGNYSLDFSYIGATPPSPVSGIVLEPLIWYMLGVPGNTGGTLGELFDGALDLASYGDNQAAGGWIMFGFEATQLNTSTGHSGAYRMLSLSEPVPQGTGFWIIHLNNSAVLLTLPPGTTNANGTIGGGCSIGSSCIRTALDAPAEGGWTIGAVPSIVVPSASDFRFQTSSPANLCVDGCNMDEAATIDYAAPNGFFVYDSLAGRYQLRAGTDSIAPWSGFWIRANTPAVPGSPELLIPVE